MQIFKNNFIQKPPNILMDQVNGVWYYGEAWSLSAATSQSVWKITRITFPVTVEYADGDTNFNNIWDNRLSLSYS